MIQRKQTIYLLCAAILLALMLFMPIANVVIGGKASSENTEIGTDGSITKTTVISNSEVELNAWGITIDEKQDIALIPLTCMIIASALFALILIFLYKNRNKQSRLCLVLCGLIVGIMLYLAIYINELRMMTTSQQMTDINYEWAASFPILALVMVIIANSGIRKDIKLIKSLDRIR